jgi:hypothetical protein
MHTSLKLIETHFKLKKKKLMHFKLYHYVMHFTFYLYHLGTHVMHVCVHLSFFKIYVHVHTYTCYTI